jgi:uncharacterized Zn finger protein
MAVVTMGALFSEAELRRAAGEKSYVRGLDYVDAIADLEIGADQVTATVYGTDAYEIVLILDDGSATGNCSCPHGRDGFFCKHLVATALAVLRQGDIPRQRAAAAAKARSLESWLEELSRDDLLTLVREQVSEDRGLRHRLELRAAAAGSDLGAVQARVRELLDARGVSQYGYIEYADTLAYSGQVDEVVIAINGLIDAGHGAQAAAIARQALAAVVEAMEQADDSGGYIGDSTHALAAAHARACAAAPGDPVELAGWLASFVLGGGQVLPDFATDGYRDALGERGTAEYRRLITQAWRGNPSGWHEKYLMQELLRADGDVDALVAMYAADMLPSGYTHLMIAQELDQAGRATAALEWAERGLREAAGGVDARLADYLAARYEGTGEFDGVLAVRQDAFNTGRTLVRYRALRDAACKAGQWEAVRERALPQLQSDAAGIRTHGRADFGWGDGPVWISALIDDGDIAAAWDAAAGIASARQWLTLADLLSGDRPADALPVYLRAVEPLRSQTGDAAYQQVAALLVKIRDCHERLGTGPQFAGYLAMLRADQKRKRNLIKLLDQRGLRT